MLDYSVILTPFPQGLDWKLTQQQNNESELGGHPSDLALHHTFMFPDGF